MSFTVYTDISFVRRLANGDDGQPVLLFGYALVVKTADGRIGTIHRGTKPTATECTHEMETAAIAMARHFYPKATIISDCKQASGWDALADKADPFHQIAHFAARSSLYTRLVTSGVAYKGRMKRARLMLAKVIQT